MESEQRTEHQWLQRLVGEWTYESEAVMEPGKPTTKSTWTESVRALGDLWIVCEGRGDMPDGCAGTTIMTLGYDPVKQRFVGTFIGSMMTHLWVYEGELDSTGRRLVLNTEGPSMLAEGKTVKYRDIIEMAGDGRRMLSSSALGDDGEWHNFMTANYWRT
jgi:hypothetical protein